MGADQTTISQALSKLLVAVVVIPLIILLIPVVIFWLTAKLFLKLVVLICIWAVWGVKGKDLLVIYSDSPYWKEYFENGLLPQIESRSYSLNLSTRAKMQTYNLQILAFDLFKYEKDYNPMVVLFPFLRWPRRYQYYQAFKEFKHGKENALTKVENQVFEALNQSLTNPHPR